MKIEFKSKLYAVVMLAISCGVLSATEQAVSDTVIAAEQQTEAAKKKVKELAAALQQQGEESAALLSSEQKTEESIISEASTELPSAESVR
jgi:hypothetical protein